MQTMSNLVENGYPINADLIPAMMLALLLELLFSQKCTLEKKSTWCNYSNTLTTSPLITFKIGNIDNI